jgi:2-polyprenyl-3-methyl-5-hydroxy-6-metoxy-1,4-benzoquinol methylase
VATIGKAYARYYTHAGTNGGGPLGSLKQRLRNEYWSCTFKTSIQPRLGLPRELGWALAWLKPYIAEPFGLRQWAQEPKGLLIDVGCGNGEKLKLAAQLGWQTLGIEMDASAVQAAQAQGLNVVQGGYEMLVQYPGQADCVVCSHVLEHVHQPLHLLHLLLAALRPQGILLLSAPNAASQLRRHYGQNWRGLEAPRHLAIPDAAWLMGWVRSQGFDCTQVPAHPLETAVESERMRRRAPVASPQDAAAAKTVVLEMAGVPPEQDDVVQLVCTRALRFKPGGTPA